MASSFRDRFFTPPVAKSMTSASGIMAFGIGAAAGMLTGNFLVAFACGAVAWAARVAYAIPRKPKADRIDPFTLNEPWRQLTRDALGTEIEFQDAIKSSPRGAMRDRLSALGDRVDSGVQEAWRVARAGHTLSQAYERVNVDADLRALAELQANPNPSELDIKTIASLESQLATGQRMADTITETRDKLRLLNARMGELVTRTIELSVSSSSPDSLDMVDSDLTDVTHDLEALRQAVDITSQAETYGTGTPDFPTGETRPGGAT